MSSDDNSATRKGKDGKQYPATKKGRKKGGKKTQAHNHLRANRRGRGPTQTISLRKRLDITKIVWFMSGRWRRMQV